MRNTYLIFDYFKSAFHINRKNKKIYLPQIALIVLQVIMIVITSLSIYSLIGSLNLHMLDDDMILNLLIEHGIKTSILLLIYGIVYVIIECGLFNIYKAAVLSNDISMKTFWDGVQKYFLKFLLGKIVVFISWVIILPLYAVVGVISLFIGFVLIPFIISVYLTMWKISLVMNDSSIISAFKDSFKFAKRNFIPLSVLQLIHWSFTKNYSYYNGNQFNYSNSINIDRIDTELVSSVLKFFIIGMIPFIVVSSIVTSLIHMIFEVFFSLALFVAYNNNFHNEDTPNKEVAS